jgi:hypothetical protein
MSTKLNLSSESVEILSTPDRFPVTISSALRNSGWLGGQFVKYVENENNVSEFTVDKSKGVYSSGFLLFGGENYSDPRTSTYRNFTSYQNMIGLPTAVGGSNVVTMISGGARCLFLNYETISLNGQGQRAGGVAQYTLNESLKISENGLLCNDPDNLLLLATGGQETLTVGFCCKTPNSEDLRLGVDLKY